VLVADHALSYKGHHDHVRCDSRTADFIFTQSSRALQFFIIASAEWRTGPLQQMRLDACSQPLHCVLVGGFVLVRTYDQIAHRPCAFSFAHLAGAFLFFQWLGYAVQNVSLAALAPRGGIVIGLTGVVLTRLQTQLALLGGLAALTTSAIGLYHTGVGTRLVEKGPTSCSGSGTWTQTTYSLTSHRLSCVAATRGLVADENAIDGYL
jgi:hypothetical protein